MLTGHTGYIRSVAYSASGKYALSSSRDGIILPSTAGQVKPAPRKFPFDRERYFYNDSSRRTGAIVFSSSRGSEVSFERDDLQNGVCHRPAFHGPRVYPNAPRGGTGESEKQAAFCWPRS
ncbi:MAG: hypothetical protein HY897_07730 [Deltaproteobacteria bacterium]|nr:hypothetical protein [Deltaproteobacteria bacterium]